ncbi:hypothetical protein GCM10009837_40230 [Streptomyces durmitorensis]
MSQCGDRLPLDTRSDARFCCATCRCRQWQLSLRVRRRWAAVHRGAGMRQCPECGTAWIASLERRKDAVFRSGRCRTRAWRRRAESFSKLSQ